MNKKLYYVAAFMIGVVALLGVSRPGHSAGKAAAAVAIKGADIGGVVSSANGPEAGVWVIAETKDLPTGFRKIVVTDDQGRYLVPDLPKANYQVWVRGYGLVASRQGAGRARQAAESDCGGSAKRGCGGAILPAAYWYSMLHIPPKSDFPGTGDNGNGISDRIKDQANWVELVKTDGCQSCHQLGDKATREIPANLGAFDSSVAAWNRRIQSGQVGTAMVATISRLGSKRALELFADWTDRVKAGELPPVPPRPQGVERNVVVTEWDWAEAKDYFHDEIATDRRNPNSNANGFVYGVHENSTDLMTVLDPVHNKMSQIPIPVNPGTPQAEPAEVLQPSAYWGSEPISTAKATSHSLMMDCAGPNLDRRSNSPAGRFGLLQARQRIGQRFPAHQKFAASQRVRSEDEAMDAIRSMLRHAALDVCGRRQ